jgi:SPP1 gp7 family putative phage head morphogenesis protein
VPIPDAFWEEEQRRLMAILVPKLQAGALAGAVAAANKVGIGINYNLANQAASDWAKTYAYNLIGGITDKTRADVQSAMAAWIEKPGSTIGDLVAELSPKFANNIYRADLIAVTETTRAYANGEKQAYQDAGIKRWRWNTNRDDLVCPFCGPLNGKVVEIGQLFGTFRGEEISEPPGHPGCRCWCSPVVGNRQSQQRGLWLSP